jgi:SAM-dependent methyltransferase
MPVEQEVAVTGERVAIGRRTNWFWDGRSAAHVARYLFARSRIRRMNVLDAACGTGYGTSLLSGRADHVTGLDYSADALAFARTHWATRRVSFIRGDIREIPAADASFDAVVSFETIEHVPNPSAAIGEFARVLPSGGVLILSTPDRHVYNQAIGNRNPFHLGEVDAVELRELIESDFVLENLLIQLPQPGGRRALDQPTTIGVPPRKFQQGAKQLIKRLSGRVLSEPAIAAVALPRLRPYFTPRAGEAGNGMYLVALCRRR